MSFVRVLETIAVAFSMYSALPMPQFEWNQRNMRFSFCAFPLIGLVIGALCGFIAWAGAVSYTHLDVYKRQGTAPP